MILHLFLFTLLASTTLCDDFHEPDYGCKGMNPFFRSDFGETGWCYNSQVPGSTAVCPASHTPSEKAFPFTEIGRGDPMFNAPYYVRKEFQYWEPYMCTCLGGHYDGGGDGESFLRVCAYLNDYSVSMGGLSTGDMRIMTFISSQNPSSGAFVQDRAVMGLWNYQITKFAHLLENGYTTMTQFGNTFFRKRGVIDNARGWYDFQDPKKTHFAITIHFLNYKWLKHSRLECYQTTILTDYNFSDIDSVATASGRTPHCLPYPEHSVEICAIVKGGDGFVFVMVRMIGSTGKKTLLDVTQVGMTYPHTDISVPQRPGESCTPEDKGVPVNAKLHFQVNPATQKYEIIMDNLTINGQAISPGESITLVDYGYM